MRKNRIKKLEDASGNILSDSGEIGHAATEYFQHSFIVDQLLDASPIVDLIDLVINDDTNASLCAEYYGKKILDALFQIASLKALGPNGLPACFFQHSWGTLKHIINYAVK